MSKQALENYFNAIIKDMASQNDKVPVGKFRIEADNISAKLYAPDYFKYMVTGRGPGKFPPPDRMLSWVQANPSILASAQATFKYITEKGLAYIIGRKIAREGTDIYQGKRKGVDFIGALERNMPDLLQELIKNQLFKIHTSIQTALK